MKRLAAILAGMTLLAGLAGCGEPTYAFKGRGYTPPGETSYAYLSDDGGEGSFRPSAKPRAGA